MLCAGAGCPPPESPQLLLLQGGAQQHCLLGRPEAPFGSIRAAGRTSLRPIIAARKGAIAGLPWARCWGRGGWVGGWVGRRGFGCSRLGLLETHVLLCSSWLRATAWRGVAWRGWRARCSLLGGCVRLAGLVLGRAEAVHGSQGVPLPMRKRTTGPTPVPAPRLPQHCQWPSLEPQDLTPGQGAHLAAWGGACGS